MTSPIAYPVASLNKGGFCLQDADGPANSVPECTAIRRNIGTASQRAGRSKAMRSKHVISERELEVLRSVERLRFLTARQIERLHFTAHASPVTAARTCRRVLERLADGGLLRRLDRRIGGIYAGSASYVYGLGTMGYRVLHGRSASHRFKEPSEESLDHTLGVAQLVVDVHAVANRDDVELLSVDPEPGCWRRFSGGLDGPQILKPDLAVSLRMTEFDYHWFVEVDRATHSAAAVVRKCKLYQRYWQAGIEQEHSGLFPRVLFVVPSVRRAQLIERSIRQAHHLNPDLFAVATGDDALQWLTGAKS